MPINSRAAVCLQAGAPLEIMDLCVADPQANEILVRLEATGICHSDLNFISGAFAHKYPAVFGHEGIGRVVTVGSGVIGFTEGDRVMPYLLPHCGVCAFCRSGKTNHCVEFQRNFVNPDDTPFSVNSGKVASFFGIGTFSEFTVVRQDQLVKVSSVAPATPTCCVGCGVATGLGAVLKTANIEQGSMVVIFGAGGVGLSAIQGAVLGGAKSIIAVDVVAEKEAVALKVGATHFVNSSKVNAVERILELTQIGADYCFECVGSAELTRQAFACANRGWGEVISVGMIPDSTPSPIVASTLRNRTWKRTLMGSATLDDIATYVEWYVEGKIDLSEIVSHRISLDQINDGIDLMHHGKATRVVIEY